MNRNKSQKHSADVSLHPLASPSRRRTSSPPASRPPVRLASHRGRLMKRGAVLESWAQRLKGPMNSAACGARSGGCSAQPAVDGTCKRRVRRVWDCQDGLAIKSDPPNHHPWPDRHLWQSHGVSGIGSCVLSLCFCPSVLAKYFCQLTQLKRVKSTITKGAVKHYNSTICVCFMLFWQHYPRPTLDSTERHGRTWQNQ